MVVGYYPDQISEYTNEEQFREHEKVINAIEQYYKEHGAFYNSYDSKRKIDSERNVLEKHYRKFKKKERGIKNG